MATLVAFFTLSSMFTRQSSPFQRTLEDQTKTQNSKTHKNERVRAFSKTSCSNKDNIVILKFAELNFRTAS